MNRLVVKLVACALYLIFISMPTMMLGGATPFITVPTNK